MFLAHRLVVAVEAQLGSATEAETVIVKGKRIGHEMKKNLDERVDLAVEDGREAENESALRPDLEAAVHM